MTKGLLLAILAAAAGWTAGEFISRTVPAHNLLGRATGRGKVLAMAGGRGVFETDVDGEQVQTLDDAIVRENLRARAQEVRVDEQIIRRELELLQAQFPGADQYRDAMHSAGLSAAQLRADVHEMYGGLAWTEKRVARGVDDGSIAKYYAEHAADFDAPARFRIAHIFLAAHAATPPDVVEKQRRLIEDISRRLAAGEDFAQLAAAISEDATTRARGGDLGSIGSWRTPPEIFERVAAMHAGETSAPFQSHLGFHIFRLTEAFPARRLSLAEARSEIAASLANEARSAACVALRKDLARADFRRDSNDGAATSQTSGLHRLPFALIFPFCHGAPDT